MIRAGARRSYTAAIMLGAALALGSCAPKSSVPEDRILLELWKHDTSQNERDAHAAMVKRFNAAQDRYHVETLEIPQASYSDALIVGALADQMPCLLDLDNPMLANFVWAGFTRPLDGLVGQEVYRDVAPSAIGRINGEVHALGQFDAALALFTRRSTLEAVNARIPTIDRPWSKAEFEQILARLKASGKYSYPLDLHTRDGNPDWWLYAFLPMLQSFGGDIAAPDNPSATAGYFNGPKSAEFVRWFAGLFEQGYVNRREPDDRGLQKGRVAMTYTGNWWVKDIAETLGDDLLILPPPDLGAGVVIGGGSWQWAISRDCAHPEGAAEFIRFIMSDAEVAAMSEAAGMVPVTAAAAEQTSMFKAGGDWRIFFDYSRAFARQRPKTPAFATLKTAFTKALQDSVDGADIRDALDDAVDDIDQVVASNGGYATGTGAGR